MARTIVGVKDPESNIGLGLSEAKAVVVGEAKIDGVALGIKETLGLGEGVGVCVGDALGLGDKDPEGVDSKAGPSDAETTKLRTKVLVIPLTSFQEIVILWVPGSKLAGGLQLQVPSFLTARLSVTISDSTVIVIAVPFGPSPKNSGSVVVITSP